MSQPITFSCLQDLHLLLWNFGKEKDDDENKKKIYTAENFHLVQEAEYYISQENSSETNLQVEDSDYGIPWQLIKSGYVKVKAREEEEWWEYKENQLTVKSKPNKDPADEVEKYDEGVLHRGISKRFFSKSFTIANDVEVKGAELKDGLLKVSMERIIPEHKKAKLIDIK